MEHGREGGPPPYLSIYSIPIRVASLDVSVIRGIKGLHLDESEGARAVKALKDNVWDVGKASSMSLLEDLHALVLATAGATINVHMIMPKDSRAHAAKHPTYMYQTTGSWHGGNADAMGAYDGAPANRGNGSIGDR